MQLAILEQLQNQLKRVEIVKTLNTILASNQKLFIKNKELCSSFQMELLSDRSFDFDTLDAIPYLTDEESLITPKHQRAERMAAPVKDGDESWPNMNDYADSDIYDFIPNSRRNDELISLQGSLPLAEEVSEAQIYTFLS